EKLYPLGVTTKIRSRALPSVPTISEGGVPDYEAATWYALLAPAHTPQAVLERLNQETVQIVGTDEVRERLGRQGLETTGSSRQELAALIRQEIAKWQEVGRGAGGESRGLGAAR